MELNGVSRKTLDVVRAKVWFKYNLRLLMPENQLRAMKAIDEAVVLARQDTRKEIDISVVKDAMRVARKEVRQDALKVIQKHYDTAKRIDAKDDMDLLEGIIFELKELSPRWLKK